MPIDYTGTGRLDRDPVRSGLTAEEHWRRQVGQAIDAAILKSPPACPDLDQEMPHSDESLTSYPDNDASWIIAAASNIVSGDRAEQHGPKERNHQNIANLWNAYLRMVRPSEEIELFAFDVAIMMILLKIARASVAGRLNRDNYIDMAGYAGIAGEIALGETD